jgi:5'-nucleotidase
LRDGRYLTQYYAKKAHELYNKYHPIEIDSSIAFEERKSKMLEWWKTHYELLIECGLNKKDIERLVNDDKIRLREGINEFFNLLNNHKIPLVIMSSSGLGDAISMVLSKNKILFSNVNIISNQFIFQEDGKAINIKEPIIHSLNKKEIEVKDYNIYEKINDKKNIILIGNTISDIDMAEGFNFYNIIKIGFLNDLNETPIEEFKKHFDVVILNDPDMNYVNNLIRDIIDKSV